jgi:hypothetical protein
MRNVGVLLFIAIVLVLGPSCSRNRYRVNLSGIEADIAIKRLEKDLFAVNPLEMQREVPALTGKYGSFLQLFSYVINIGDISAPAWHENLTLFVTDRMNNEAYEAVKAKYADIRDIEDDLRQGFRHYLYYFPGRYVPEIYTCITGFNNSIIVGDSLLGVSLDRYLGPDCEFYKMLGIYQYLTLKMDRANIVPDCMYAWAFTEWNFEEMEYGIENVFARIIHEGKLLYFMRCMLPKLDEAVLMGFTDDQLKFCVNNEEAIWTYMVEHDLLFSTDPLIIKKLSGEAPFTSYFTSESPGRAALWTGFRIVEEFMRRNQTVTLPDLMAITDYQSILTGAKYNPR